MQPDALQRLKAEALLTQMYVRAPWTYPASRRERVVGHLIGAVLVGLISWGAWVLSGRICQCSW